MPNQASSTDLPKIHLLITELKITFSIDSPTRRKNGWVNFFHRKSLGVGLDVLWRTSRHRRWGRGSRIRLSINSRNRSATLRSIAKSFLPINSKSTSCKVLVLHSFIERGDGRIKLWYFRRSSTRCSSSGSRCRRRRNRRFHTRFCLIIHIDRSVFSGFSWNRVIIGDLISSWQNSWRQSWRNSLRGSCRNSWRIINRGNWRAVILRLGNASIIAQIQGSGGRFTISSTTASHRRFYDSKIFSFISFLVLINIIDAPFVHSVQVQEPSDSSRLQLSHGTTSFN